MIHNVFEITFSYTAVTLADGRILYREIWPNTRGVGTVTGLTSGHVWRRDIRASPYILHSGGPSDFERYVYNGPFVSETGPTITVHETFQVSTNANGEVVVDQFESTCQLAK
jgi:hypothetical protein